MLLRLYINIFPSINSDIYQGEIYARCARQKNKSFKKIKKIDFVNHELVLTKLLNKPCAFSSLGNTRRGFSLSPALAGIRSVILSICSMRS